MILKYKDAEGTIRNINETVSSISDEFDPESETAMSGIAISELAPFKLGIDASGRYGYIKENTDTIIPF